MSFASYLNESSTGPGWEMCPLWAEVTWCYSCAFALSQGQPGAEVLTIPCFPSISTAFAALHGENSTVSGWSLLEGEKPNFWVTVRSPLPDCFWELKKKQGLAGLEVPRRRAAGWMHWEAQGLSVLSLAKATPRTSRSSALGALLKRSSSLGVRQEHRRVRNLSAHG